MERDDSQLVEHLGWVQRLALSLARDRDAADDLTQDVARVWLEKRPALSGGPRSWLAAVARKLAVDRARSEVSRKAREQSAARPEGEGFEVVERGARQRRVVEAVLQLAEPYRSTILYRYLDDLSTRAVAERMGVPEATVRKRIERGLALLRERLDREFGGKSNAWAIGLLEPGLRTAFVKGVGIMSLKWIAAAGVVALLAGVAWYVNEHSSAGAAEAVGGMGVVVPPEVAAAREKPAQAPEVQLETADAATRADLPAQPAPSTSVPRLSGLVFVDEVNRAPAGLQIVRKADKTRVEADAAVDLARASWSLEPLGGEPGILWITSDATVPAQIPVPPEVWTKGGVFDLHLSGGSTLALTLLDAETQRPIPDLEFEVTRQVELERTRERVGYNGNDTRYRTDASGRAQVLGVPLRGWISVSVDFELREREVLMKGQTSRMRLRRDPDFELRLKGEQPTRIEQTILVRPPQGEAVATGQVPAWAVSVAGGAENVRVAARETTRETKQRMGMSFLLACDAQGHFELRANAPATHAVWLERVDDLQRLSSETSVVFERPGAQDSITFGELEGRKLTLRFVHVPERGRLQVGTVGKNGMGPTSEIVCRGAEITRELVLSGDQRIQLGLRLAEGKSGWNRTLVAGDEREITVDLGGCERRVRLECSEIDLAGRDGALSLMRVDDGAVLFDQQVIVLCTEGRGTTSVHVPIGRWLYRYDDKLEVGVWGVVDVAAATQPGEELVLRPRLRLAPIAELENALRLDEVEGVSLAPLPPKLRVLSARGDGPLVALPRDAKFGTLEGK